MSDDCPMRMKLAGFVAHGKDVVALQREIIEAGGVGAPARHVRFFRAHDVRRRAHLHAAETERAVHQPDLEFDGHARLDDAGRQKVNAARTDVACNQRDRDRLDHFAYSRQAKRQRKRSARIAAALVRNADRMRRHAGEAPWPRFSRS